MPTDTVDPKAKELADRFRAMATSIELNGVSTFGGAFVIIPPENGGDPLHTLVLDTKQDAAQFWILLKSKAETEIRNVDAKASQQGFGGRR